MKGRVKEEKERRQRRGERRERARERMKERGDMFYLLVYFLNSCNNQDWAKLK